MIPILRASDCSPEPIRGWTLGVLGYGNQGRAQAQNLRDSSYEVRVAARAEGTAGGRARSDGFVVGPLDQVALEVDLLAILTPDQTHVDVIRALREWAPSRLRTLVFAHGFALRFQQPALDPAWDVAVVAPAGPGVQLRTRYIEGGGLPAILAVAQDASGSAAARALAYAAGIGSARAGVIVSTVREEAEIDLFGEQAVLCGGMNALLAAAFDTLVGAGYPPEMAYLECVQQLRLTAELVERFGIEGMRSRISGTALFGDLTRGERVIDETVRARLREILNEIGDGTFAREWMDAQSGGTALPERLSMARHRALETAGERIRALFEGERSERKND